MTRTKSFLWFLLLSLISTSILLGHSTTLVASTESPSVSKKKTASLTVVMTQTAGPNPVTAVGQVITYRIILTNTGEVNLTQVTVTETYPGTGTGYLFPAKRHESLNKGEKWIYTAIYKVSQADITASTELINTVSVVTKEVPGPTIVTVTTLVAPLVTPKFIQIGPLCRNSTPPTLPAISTNGITGTWIPATINTVTAGTRTYIFIPDPDQHSSIMTMKIVVTNSVTPTFTKIEPLCQGSVAPVLPLTSSNIPAINGTWSPTEISTAAAGTITYVFSPDPGQCATTSALNITVNSSPITTLSGSTSVSTGSTGNVYTTEAGMNNYVWNVSAGGTITEGGTSTSNTATVTWNTPGPQSISVNYANNNGCTAASAATYNVTVNPLLTLTIASVNINKMYGSVYAFDMTSPSTDFIITGLQAGDAVTSVSLTCTGAAAGANVGTYPITVSNAVGAGLENYTIVYQDRTLTVDKAPITIAANAVTKVYGNLDPPITFQVTSGNLFNGDTFSGSLIRDAGENVGTYAISQGSLANSNYAITYAGANLTITPLPVSVFAEPKTKVYGQNDPGLTFISILPVGTVLSNGHVIAFTGSLSRGPGEAVLGRTYAINQGSLANSNYIINFVGSDLTITPLPISVMAEYKFKSPGTTDPALTYSSAPAVGTILANYDVISFTGSLSRAPGEAPGVYPIGQNTLGNSNYTIAYTGASLYIWVGTCSERCMGVTITQTAGPNPVTAAGQVITYKIVLYNEDFPYYIFTGIVLTWEHTGTGLGTLSPKTESISSDNVLERFETWTYLATYTVTDEDITRGWDLPNIITVMTDQNGPYQAHTITPVAGTKSLISRSTNLTDSGAKNVNPVLQSEFGLKAYPNPFSDNVYFDLQMKTDSKVRLEVFNIEGTKLSTVYDDVVVAYDRYRFEYTPENFSTGMLIYRLIVDGQLIFTGKLIHY